MTPANGAWGPRSWWFRLADHDVDEPVHTQVRLRWIRHWGIAALHGAVCAAISMVGLYALTQIGAPPVGPVLIAIGNLVAALLVLGVLLAVATTTASYAVVWLIETVRGQCPRPIGVAAVGVAGAGTGLSVVASAHGVPAVTRWLSGGFANLRTAGAAAGNVSHTAMSAEVVVQFAATAPWLAMATVIAATIWHGPHSGPAENRAMSGRLDYRTVDATGYLPATLLDQYRHPKRGNANG